MPKEKAKIVLFHHFSKVNMIIAINFRKISTVASYMEHYYTDVINVIHHIEKLNKDNLMVISTNETTNSFQTIP